MNKTTARHIRQLKEVFKQLEMASQGLDISDFDTPEEAMEALRIWHQELAKRGAISLPMLEAVIEAYEEGHDIKSLIDIDEIMSAKKWQKKQANTGS